MPTKLPLSGVNVVEVGTMITAPYAAMILAELGAEVIKVERPDGGDPFRGFQKEASSPQFAAFNKQKRSIALDLTARADIDVLLRLLSAADVLIENFRPGVMERLGLTDARLSSEFPKLVHCSITGFGRNGPYYQRPAFDTVGQALGGLLGLFVNSDNPRIAGPTVSDNVTGLYAAIAILAALNGRGRGVTIQRAEVDMLSSSVAFAPEVFASYFESGQSQTPFSRVAVSQAFVVRCLDAKLLSIHLSSPEKFWTGFVAALEEPALADDPRFASRKSRVIHYDALHARIAEICSTRDRRYWMMQLEAHDVPFAPVHNASEVVADEQVHHLGIFGKAEDQTGSAVQAVASPILFDGERNRNFAAAPHLNQHGPSIRNTGLA